MEAGHDFLFKIIIVGDSGVGKTSLMKRYTDGVYAPDSASTIGVDFKIKTVAIDGKKVKLQIWDTAGQERFRAIVSHYYRGAHGIMLVFDMGDRESFEHLRDWLGEIERNDAPKSAQIRILGNKVDCVEKIQVRKEEIQEFLQSHNLPESCFLEVSAQGGTNVEESFLALTKRLIATFGAAGVKATSKISFKTDGPTRNSCC